MEPPQPMGGHASGLSSLFASGSNGAYPQPQSIPNLQPFGQQMSSSSFGQQTAHSFYHNGNGGSSGISASLPVDSGLPMWMAPSFNSSVFPPLMTQQQQQQSPAFPLYGQPGPSYYMNPDALQFLQQQHVQHQHQQQQQQQQQQSSLGPGSAGGPAVTKTSASPPDDGSGSFTPHRRQPPKRQRSRSDASALPYDFVMSSLSSTAATMNPNMLSDLGGGGNNSFFPGQAQQMESPSSSPRSISSLLPPGGGGGNNLIPAFNPLPPSELLPSGSYPAFGHSPNGSDAGGSEAGDSPAGGPRRPSHTLARSFGAGTPGYGVGLLHPHGANGSETAGGSVGVQRSVSDAGRGRQGHRKVRRLPIDLTPASSQLKRD